MQTWKFGGRGEQRVRDWGGGWGEAGLLLVIAGRISQCFPC